MNSDNVISLPAHADTPPAVNCRVKLAAGGVVNAGAADGFLGTLLPGDLNREQAAILRAGVGIHFATVAEGSAAIGEGAGIQGAADGEVTLLAAGAAIGAAVEAGVAGDCIRVVYYSAAPTPAED